MKYNILCFSGSIYLKKSKKILPPNNLFDGSKLKTTGEYKKFVKENNINLVIIFRESDTKYGLVNFFKYNLNIPTVGVTRYWAQLENSKRFAKEFMFEHNIPSPEYEIVNDLSSLKRVITDLGLPLVIKDDGLQQGFGTYICKTEKECIKTAKKLLKENDFFIAEKFIKGEEITLQTIWDGNVLIPIEPVRDYKKSKNNNEGINTGSMGSYMPVMLSDNKRKMMKDYIKKLDEVFQKKKPNFTGIFASDLIFTEENVYNLEFNMRPCIPEFEVITEHLNNDMGDIFYNIAIGNCKDLKLDYKQGITGCVCLAHKDYLKRSKHISERIVKLPFELLHEDCEITVHKDYNSINKNEVKIFTHRRFLTLINNDPVDPFPLIYKYISKIKDKNIYYRTDIGK